MTLDDAISLIPRGRSILFTGSGFSLGAKNLRKNPDGSFCDFRGVKAISNDIAVMCSLPFKEDGYQFGKISNYYLKQKSVESLIEFLKNEFTVSEINENHKQIGSYPWRRCYTTNYDNICEIAFERNGFSTSSVTMSTKPTDILLQRKTCVHINGSITKLTVATLGNEFKLTTGSYRDESFLYSPWFNIFKNDITNADAVFFIGFSGDYDLDILRVLQSSKDRKEKFFFINGANIDPISLSDMEDIGQVTGLDFEEFIHKCQELLGISIRSASVHFPIKSFREVTFRESSKMTKNLDFVNLMTLGRIDRDLLANSVRDKYDGDYFIYRSRIEKILEDINSGETTFLITSNLGNGKSMFLEGLAVRLEQNGYSPFFFDKQREFVVDEITHICSNRDKPVFIFDDYGDKISVIRNLTIHIANTVPLILSERNTHYETSTQSIDFIDPKLVNIDVLESNEIKNVVRLFRKNGLWGGMARRSDEQLERFVLTQCRGQFSYFLLKRFDDTGQLHDSYRKLIEAIHEKEEFYNTILFLLTFRYFGINMEYTEMIESIGGDVVNNISFKNNPNIRELIDFKNDEVSFKSSLLAFYLLKKHISSDDFVDFYIKLFNSLDKKISGNKRIKSILRSLMPYSMLFRILGRNQPIFTIYENISDGNFTRTNPLFWLQLAIARNADGDFSNAEKCFKTAYSYAEAIGGYDTYQIDTHHAHFLLSRAVRTDNLDGKTPMELFRGVHQILKRVRKSEKYRYHIYKVAQDYLPFWKKYKHLLDTFEIADFKEACHEITMRAEEYLANPGTSSKEIVKNTIVKLKEIVIPSNS